VKPLCLQVKRSGEVVVNIFPVCASHQHEPAAPCRSVTFIYLNGLLL
jgi:hypothetical protein